MHTRIALLALLAAFAAGCKSVDCGDGTSEQDGTCVPANVTVSSALCGPFTELRGTQCMPMFPPTVCDPDSTDGAPDTAGVINCKAKGGGGCSAKISCPLPTAGKQTICGQLYDFENDQPFAVSDALGAKCSTGCAATEGPCALTIRAYDAVAFVSTQGMTPPLPVEDVYIDECGRFKIQGITPPAVSPFIALGIDDAMAGPAGLTNAVGIATATAPNTATELEGFVVRPATSAAWMSSGGPSLASGIFAQVFRGRRAGAELAAGVTFTFAPMTTPTNQMPNMGRDFYFASGATTRMTLDPAANATGANGTALISGATLAEVYSGGGGGLPPQCLWEIRGGAAVPGVIFIQLFRPMNFPGMTCPL